MDLDNLCTTCGKTFLNYLLRSKHEIAYHSGKLLGCTECSYTAFGSKNLSNHMQKHQESQCCFTNGEFGETCHSTLKMFEKQKGFYRNKNFGSDDALVQAHHSHSTFTGMKMGSPARILSIRPSSRSSPGSSPRSSPSRPGWNKKESLVKKYLYGQNS